MQLPYFSEVKKTRDYQTTFFGYNHTPNCQEGEFYNMKNMSSDMYPVLSQRKERGIYPYPEGGGEYKAKALISKDALCYISGRNFYINNYKVPDFDILPMFDEEGKEIPITMVSMGAYVIILPQKIFINTKDYSDKGSIDSEFPSLEEEHEFSFSLAKEDGSVYENLPTVKPVEGTETENPFYIDTTNTPNVVKQYSESSKSWVSVPTTYVKISCPGIAKAFAVGDGIKISGIEAETVKHLNGAHVIYNKDESEEAEYIVIIGMISTPVTVKNLKFERKMPDLDFVIESQNRLWGCKYGPTDDGVVNQIYASKLGDFKNWNCFESIASDSYSVGVGSDGPFTGAITFQGTPIFFKEDCLHKVYGNIPANYQVQTTACNGVQKGSERSLEIVNNVLFYKGIAGIYAYDGSLPSLASADFGDVLYENAVGGAFGNKYYVSLERLPEKSCDLFVFDTTKGLWHREDDLQVSRFCQSGSELYFTTKKDDQIHTMFGSGVKDEEELTWFVETGILGKDSPDKKTLTKINARMKIYPKTRISIFAEYDSTGAWQHLYTMEGRTLQSFSIPIRLHRCDHARIKIVGKGRAQIYSISKTVKEGSDR